MLVNMCWSPGPFLFFVPSALVGMYYWTFHLQNWACCGWLAITLIGWQGTGTVPWHFSTMLPSIITRTLQHWSRIRTYCLLLFCLLSFLLASINWSSSLKFHSRDLARFDCIAHLRWPLFLGGWHGRENHTHIWSLKLGSWNETRQGSRCPVYSLGKWNCAQCLEYFPGI